MEASEYQVQAARTLIDKPDFEISDKQIMIVWCAVGLAGEAGEVVEHIKKGVFHQHGLSNDVLRKELGDVLWYIAGICTTLGLDLGEIMQMNVGKLKKRYPNGWSAEDSKNRGGNA